VIRVTILRDNRDLLDRFRRGEPDALEEVYRTYVGVVDSVAGRGIVVASSGARVSGPAEYQDRLDLVQETFTRAFGEKARMAYDGVREYRPYLLSICRNLVVDWARRTARELPTGFSEEQIEAPDTAEEPGDAWADPVARRAVEDYLARLPADLLEVHRQRFVLGVSQTEAARAMGLTRQRVRTLESKLKKGLRRELKRSAVKKGAP
jgi:RNA polymerase sigma factor (sigma-70 family)